RRDSAHGTAADSWYVRQVAGFVWRATWWWGVLLASTVIIRSALDWFVPPATFAARAAVTTRAPVALFAAAGFWSAWRTRSLAAGVLGGMVMGVISAALVVAGSLAIL